MSAVLENLIQRWIQAGALNLDCPPYSPDEGAEEVKGYIPKTLKLQFKLLCTKNQIGMGLVLQSLIQEWVGCYLDEKREI